MKIQSTTTKSVAQKKKASTTSTNTFGALFAEQVDSAEPQQVQSSPEQSHENTPQNKEAPNLLDNHLQALEEQIANLANDTNAQEDALHTINTVKDALYQSNLSPQDLEEADTLLRVEAQRLETLKKYK